MRVSIYGLDAELNSARNGPQTWLCSLPYDAWIYNKGGEGVAGLQRKPGKLAQFLEKPAKNRTPQGFSIDKRAAKPHRKRRWGRFYPHKHWRFLRTVRICEGTLSVEIKRDRAGGAGQCLPTGTRAASNKIAISNTDSSKNGNGKT